MRNTILIPQTELRECSLCLRDLSLGNFGMRRSNEDMYDNTCRDCHRHCRKVSYYRRLEKLGRLDPLAKARALPYSFPLNENNRLKLGAHFTDSNLHASTLHDKISMPAEFVKSGEKLVVEVAVLGGLVEMRVSDGSVYAIPEVKASSFVATAVMILRELKIRLK